MYPTSPTAELIKEFFDMFIGMQYIDDDDIESNEVLKLVLKPLSYCLQYRCVCIANNIEADFDTEETCDCCKEDHLHFLFVDNLCFWCDAYISNHYYCEPQIEKKSFTSTKLKESKKTMECPICFDNTYCYEFFECNHKCCFDCVHQMTPCKCYYNCE